MVANVTDKPSNGGKNGPFKQYFKQNAYSSRGNTSKRLLYSSDKYGGGKQKTSREANTRSNTITNLRKGKNGKTVKVAKYLPNYGNRASDGKISQTGCMEGSGYGFKGNFDTIATLIQQSGGKRQTDVRPSYAASSELAPPASGAVLNNNGLQLRQAMQMGSSDIGLIPPNQDGNVRKKMKKESANKLPASRRSEGVLDHWAQPESFETIHDQKYGKDDDPNPIAPLAPLEPTEQQGYNPTRLKPKEVWKFKDSEGYGKKLIGRERHLLNKRTMGPDGPRRITRRPEGSSTNNFDMMRVAVHNYLWSTSNNSSVQTMANPRRQNTVAAQT